MELLREEVSTKKALKLSPKLQQTGLHVLCNLCKGEPCNGICVDKNKEEGIKGKTCRSQERHVFRVRFHVPGTKSRKITKVLGRDAIAAAQLALELYNEFKKEGALKGVESNQIEKEGPSFTYLFDYILKFLDFKCNPTKNRQPNDIQTINDYKRHLNILMEALTKKHINPKLLKVDKINNNIAQIAFDFLRDKEIKGRPAEAI